MMSDWKEICPLMTEQQHDVLRKVQLKCLELLSVFDGFCQRNGLLYYVCGGGCIGAVRHGGFIPWDDDIDVMMPREDFETFKALWPAQMDEARYHLNDNSETVFLRNMWTSVSDEETTFIKDRQKDLDISHGIKLEVIPLDGCPSGRLKRTSQIFWALVRQIYINQEPPISKGKLMFGLGKILLGMHKSWDSRYRAAMRAEKKMTKYPFSSADRVTELTTRFKYMKNEYPAEAFRRAVRVPFEDTSIPVPEGYDVYLYMAFGDYMQLPPEEDRVPKHDAIYIDTENSYRKYRGVYYLN